MIRPVAALALSAIIAGGTWFTVAKTSDEANRTANEITEQVLDAQREMTKTTDARMAESQAEAKQATDEAIDALEANDDVPDAAKAQLEAAQEQIDAAADLD